MFIVYFREICGEVEMFSFSFVYLFFCSLVSSWKTLPYFRWRWLNSWRVIFTESAPRPVQYKRRNVRLYVPSWNPGSRWTGDFWSKSVLLILQNLKLFFSLTVWIIFWAWLFIRFLGLCEPAHYTYWGGNRVRVCGCWH